MPKPDETPKTIPVVVAAGHTLTGSTEGGVHRSQGPGSIVQVPVDEVPHLRARGFIEAGQGIVDVAPPATPVASSGATPIEPRPTVNGRDGTTVSVGRD